MTERPDNQADEVFAPLWRAGRVAWPTVALDADRFEQHVRRHAAHAALHPTDLYLACACAHAVPGAAEELDRAFLVHVGHFVRRIDASADFADEVRQRLREKLLVGKAPRIAAYSGRGALRSWLHVAALRAALNLRRDGQRGDVPLREDQLAETHALDPELAYLQEHHQADFQRALLHAVAGLSYESRMAFGLQLVRGLTTGEIGQLFRVDQSTVVRWLAGARTSVRARTRELLCERLHISPSDFESLLALMLGRLELV